MSLSSGELAYQEAHIDQDRRGSIIATAVVFGGLALACVLGRFTSRRFNRVTLGLDDYLIAVAMFFGVGLVITSSLMAHWGIGRHTIAVSSDDLVLIAKTQFALSLFYPPCIAITKFSILALLRRIFTTNNRIFRLSLYGVAVYVFLWLIALWLVVLLECLPIPRNWSLTNGCEPKFKTTVSTGVTNALSDIAILVLPQPLLWKLQVSLRRKIQLSSLFLLGSFVCVISIIRIPLLKPSNEGARGDTIWQGTYGLVFTITEPMVGIICACLPVTQSLLRRLSEKGYSIGSIRALLSRSSKSRSTLGTGTGTSASRSQWSKLGNKQQIISSHNVVSSSGEESLSSRIGTTAEESPDANFAHYQMSTLSPPALGSHQENMKLYTARARQEGVSDQQV